MLPGNVDYRVASDAANMLVNGGFRAQQISLGLNPFARRVSIDVKAPGLFCARVLLNTDTQAYKS